MKKEELVPFFVALGWKEDRFGNLQKVYQYRNADTGAIRSKTRRLKFQATSVRIEVKSDAKNSSGGYDWIRVGGGYYKDIVKLPDGRIKIGTVLCGKKGE